MNKTEMQMSKQTGWAKKKVVIYDTHYKWECEDKGCIGLVLKCPHCGYINTPSIIKELVSGEHLAPFCPNCGKSMKQDVT